jgi:zinc and cadmium transporter
VANALLGGILLFFLLEKLVLWRHCHDEICEAHGSHDHGHDHGRSALMITVGDTFHNFVDGVIIAGAFLVDFRLGVITALAIIAHEIPQEIGDFVILLHSGYSRTKALVVNLLAAASMLYVALSDLIPGLHKRAEIGATLQQLVLIGLGVGSVALVGYVIGNGH